MRIINAIIVLTINISCSLENSLENIKLDFQGTVLPVSFETLFNTATREINLLSNNTTSAETKQQLQQINGQIQSIKPLLAGRVKTDIKFSGSLLEPLVSGKIETTEVTRVDRLRFKNIATKFTVSSQLNQDFRPVNMAASFSGLQINPMLGGKITGKGAVLEVDLPIATPKASSKKLEVGTQAVERFQEVSLKSQESETKFNPTVDLDLRVQNLPVEAIAQQYNITSPLPIGEFSTEVKISGPLETLKGQVQWRLPKAVYPLSGVVDIINSQANIKNTIVKIGGGTVNINGNANLENWQLNATVNQVNLDKKSLQPLGLPSGLEGIFNGKANFSGLTSKFSINSINGNGNGIVNIAGGQINLNGKLNNGNWQGKGIGSQINLSALERIAINSDILRTPNSIFSSKNDGIINGEVTLSGNLNNLSLAGVKANINGNLNLANGIINANGKVNNPILNMIKNKKYTHFLPKISTLDARKKWIVGSLSYNGTIYIDSGAAKALSNGKVYSPLA